MGNFNKYVYRIFIESEFIKFKNSKEFKGNQLDVNSGFIHLSTLNQIDGTVKRYFRNEKELSIVQFKTKDLSSYLKWEKSRDTQLFPHFYGVLKFGWVRDVKTRFNL